MRAVSIPIPRQFLAIYLQLEYKRNHSVIHNSVFREQAERITVMIPDFEESTQVYIRPTGRLWRGGVRRARNTGWWLEKSPNCQENHQFDIRLPPRTSPDMLLRKADTSGSRWSSWSARTSRRRWNITSFAQRMWLWIPSYRRGEGIQWGLWWEPNFNASNSVINRPNHFSCFSIVCCDPSVLLYGPKS